MSEKYTLLVENFLFEINKNNPRFDDPDETVLDYQAFDPEMYDEDDTLEDLKPVDQTRVNKPITIKQINSAAQKKPKMSVLKKLVSAGIIVPLAAAALMFNNASDQEVAKTIVDDTRNSVSQEKVLNVIKKEQQGSASPTSPSEEAETENKPDITLSLEEEDLSLEDAMSRHRYAGEGITTEDTESIYNFEGFRSKPYVDKGTISIGFGIQIYSKKSEFEKDGWQEVFFVNKLNKQKDDKDRITRNGKKVKLSTIKEITEAEAREATHIDMNDRIERIREIYPWFDNIPGDAKLVFLDMTYNMGLRFRMTGVKNAYRKFAENIGENDLNNWKTAVKELQNIIDNMLYVKVPSSLEGGVNSKDLTYSGYAVAGKSSLVSKGKKVHRRPKHMISILKNLKSQLQNKVNDFESQQKKKKSTNESFSLRSVYSNLYSWPLMYFNTSSQLFILAISSLLFSPHFSI